MAGNAVIGALRVVLGADTAAFESGLKKAQGTASNFGASVTKIFAGLGIGLGIEKLTEGIVHSFKAAIEHADQLGKTAQKIGVPVEELSKLELAAKLSDVSMESLTAGLGKLSKAMIEVARGGGDAADLAFRQLGISVTNADGTLRSVGDVLADVAGQFGGLKDGAAKTATAMALFGKGGKDLIPLLNEGKDGLQEMMHAAENMGLVISKDTSAQAQKFMDNLKLLDAAKQGLINTIVQGLLPALVRLSDQWVESAKDGTIMRSMADSIVESIKSVVAWFRAEAVGAVMLGEAFGELWAAIKALPSSFDDAKEHMEKMNQINMEAPAAMKAAGNAALEMFTKITVGGKQLKDLQFDANIAKAIEDLGFKTRILNQDFVNLAQGFPELAKGLVPIDQIKTSVTALTPQLQLLNAAQNDFKAAQLTQDSLLPWQQYEQILQRINLAFADGTKNPEAYAQAMKKAADAAGTSWNLAGSSIAGSFATIANSFAGTSSSMATIAKAFSIVQAIISTYTGMAKALELPFPANIAAVAAVAAQGFAFVAAIKGQAIPSFAKFAHGGSFQVGGVGGTDSQLVQFMASPTEMVDVRTPGSDRGVGNVSEITLRGRLRDILTGENIRDLFYSLNMGHRDGYRLQFAEA